MEEPRVLCGAAYASCAIASAGGIMCLRIDGCAGAQKKVQSMPVTRMTYIYLAMHMLSLIYGTV